MGNKIFLANWKSQGGEAHVEAWITAISPLATLHTILLALPFPLLPFAHTILKNTESHILLASQDISPYPEGAHTGEVPAALLANYVSAVVIGHSEERKNHNTTDKEVAQKYYEATSHTITPVLCISTITQLTSVMNTNKPAGFILYEPPSAIGTGKNEDIQDVLKMVTEIKRYTSLPVLYGGSVTPENASIYLTHDTLSGVAIGAKSIDPTFFKAIIDQTV